MNHTTRHRRVNVTAGAVDAASKGFRT